MTDLYDLSVKPATRLTAAERAGMLALCSRAFATDYARFYATFPDPTHILLRQDGQLASHALWITRQLQAGGQPLRAAYVEAVASAEEYRRRGLASAVMRRLAGEIQDYDLAALSPGAPELYARLGWEFWRGPLAIRTPDGLRPTPGEQVMILRLPQTPPGLNLDALRTAEWRQEEVW